MRAAEAAQTDGFWALAPEELARRLGSSPGGLAERDAEERRARRPTGLVRERADALAVLVAQFASPIIALLAGAAVVSVWVGDRTGAALILAIVVASGLLSFRQEYMAARAVDDLLALVTTTATVLRDGVAVERPLDAVVPGDVVLLAAGDAIPGDARVLDARELLVDEAALTGESFPAAKQAAPAAADAALARRASAVWLGTHVASGQGRALIVRTGRDTQLGAIAGRLQARPPTEFELGLRRFGHLLLELTLMLVLVIFAVNVGLHRPVLESLLFSVALAVGLTPQLLPAVVSVNLAHGARAMASRHVIVKRLAAIESFGSMDVLCCDKTGTLTRGVVAVDGGATPEGAPSDEVVRFAALNARFQSGYANPIDHALRELAIDAAGWTKLDERPWDFSRKCLSVALAGPAGPQMITKGALDSVLALCTTARLADGRIVPLAEVREAVHARAEQLGKRGSRVIGVAAREGVAQIGPTDEANLTLVGTIALSDPLKPDARAAVDELRGLGVRLVLISGDNRWIAASRAAEAGIPAERVVTGAELARMSPRALAAVAVQVDVFAEVEPSHKERLITTLRRTGHVVGFLGDGINDATALHVADVGISVDTAVDVAKDAADLVLLERDLGVLAEGVRAGRTTFANTMKYVFMATSANFGNMFSMAGASLLLPFLPLLPTQILLMNLLTDLPEMTIADDRVDAELVQAPRRWELAPLRRFMLVFGLLSSVFDFATFGVLRLVAHAGELAFRTGWFVESVASAATIVLVIRTRRPAWRSQPARSLAWTTALVVGAAFAFPLTPLAPWFGFATLSPALYALVVAIVVAYVLAAELVKLAYYRGARP